MTLSPGGRPADASPVGTPGGRQNWVDKAGGLPKYVRMVAHALMRKGMPEGKAIPAAVNRIKRWAAGMDDVRPQVQAAAKAALAEWEAKKGLALSSSPHIDAAMILDLAAPDEWVAELVATYAASEALDLAARDYVRDPVGRFATTGRSDSQGPRAGFGKAGEQREDAGKPAVDRFGPDHKYQLDSLAAIRDLMRQWRRVPFSQRNALKARMTSKAKALGGSARLLTLIGGLGDSDGKAEKGEGAAAAIRTGNVKEWLARQGLHLAADEDADELLDLAAGTLEALEGDTIDLAPGDYRPPYDWKHGFIPLTPAAAASKAKKGPHVGQGSTRRPKARAVGKAMQAAQARQKSKAAKVAGKPRVTAAEAAKNADDHARGRGVPGAPTVPTTAGPSAAEKIRNAETMHGTGSKQHLEAIRRFGDTSAAPKVSEQTHLTKPASEVKAGDVIVEPSIMGGPSKRYQVDKAHPQHGDSPRNVDVTDLGTGRQLALSLDPHRQHTVERKGRAPEGGSVTDLRAARDERLKDRFAGKTDHELMRERDKHVSGTPEHAAHVAELTRRSREKANTPEAQARRQAATAEAERVRNMSGLELNRELGSSSSAKREAAQRELDRRRVSPEQQSRQADQKYADRKALESRAKAAGYDGNLNGDGSDQLQAFLDAKEKGHPIPVGRAVNARQPGIEKVTTGRVVGYDDNGMMKVKPHHPADAPVGTFNPSHVAPAGQTPPHTPDSREGSGMRPGDRVSTEYGAGSVVADTSRSTTIKLDNGEQINVQKGTFGHERIRPLGEGGGGRIGSTSSNPTDKALRAQERDRALRAQEARDKAAGGSTVQDRTAENVAADRAAQARAIDRKDYANADGPALVDEASKRGLGNPQMLSRKSDSQLRTMLRDHDKNPSASHEDNARARAHTPDAPAAPSSNTTSTNPNATMRVEHTPDGTLVHGTERGDTEANAALKAQGFKWSRNLGAWYLPRTWNESTRDQRVKNLERTLGDKLGVDRTTGPRLSAAEREAQKRERAAGRAEHMDAKAQKLGAEASRRFEASDLREEKSGIPFGQPILVGHHSERRHRAAIERAHANLGKGVEAQKAADDAAAAAERARRTAAGNESKMTIGNRIQKNERELRDLDRRLNGTHSSMGGRKPEGDYRTRLENMRADVADQLDHDRGKLAAAGGVPSKDTVSPGDFVKIRGQWYPVKKSNAKTVGVPNTMIPGRNSTSPWHEVSEHKKADEVTRADVARMIQQNSAAFPHLKTELAKAAPEKDPTPKADAPSGGVLNMPAPTSSPEVQRAAVKRPADHGSASDPMTKPVRDLTDAQLEQAANYERQRATMRGMPEPTRAKARARHAEVLNEMNRREAERKPATVTPLDPSRGITPETAGRMSDSQLEDAMSRLMQSGTYSGPAFDVLQREMDKRDARRAEGNRPRR